MVSIARTTFVNALTRNNACIIYSNESKGYSYQSIFQLDVFGRRFPVFKTELYRV